jgi:hypothetical protein
MALETFALHARVLVEFLSEKPKGKKDVRASQFVSGFKAERKDGINDALLMLDPQIMHSARARTNKPHEKFNTNHATQLLDWVERSIVKFNDALEAPYSKGWMPPGDRPKPLPETLEPSATNYLTSQTTTMTYVTAKMSFDKLP